MRGRGSPTCCVRVTSSESATAFYSECGLLYIFIYFQLVPGKPGQPKATPFDDTAINVTFQRPSYGGLPSKFMVYYRPTGK